MARLSCLEVFQFAHRYPAGPIQFRATISMAFAAGSPAAPRPGCTSTAVAAATKASRSRVRRPRRCSFAFRQHLFRCCYCTDPGRHAPRVCDRLRFSRGRLRLGRMAGVLRFRAPAIGRQPGRRQAAAHRRFQRRRVVAGRVVAGQEQAGRPWRWRGAPGRGAGEGGALFRQYAAPARLPSAGCRNAAPAGRRRCGQRVLVEARRPSSGGADDHRQQAVLAGDRAGRGRTRTGPRRRGGSSSRAQKGSGRRRPARIAGRPWRSARRSKASSWAARPPAPGRGRSRAALCQAGWPAPPRRRLHLAARADPSRPALLSASTRAPQRTRPPRAST
jgi:hypothetical protein